MSDCAGRLVEDMKRKQEQRLCRVCDQIGTNDTWWFDETTTGSLAIYIHHPDLHTLNASSIQGCLMCRFLLETIVNSADAFDVPTTGGDIVKSSKVNNKAELGVASMKKLLQEHRNQLPDDIVFASPTSWTTAHVLSDDIFSKQFRDQGLQLLSDLCGHGRVVLTGFRYRDYLPSDLHAVALYPFGVSRVRGFKPFLTGRPFELAAGLDSPLEPLADARIVSPTLFDKNLLQLIHSWRDYCLSHHTKCRGTSGPQPLPRRVIEISPDAALHTVRLRDTRDETGFYAALSYCWGTSPQKKTTKYTLQEHLACIYVATLPNTIQDAIRLCKALEIPYLWVDSLCILQDDAEDWRHEASEMGAIYGQSALTITTPYNSQCDQNFGAPNNKDRDDSCWPQLLWEHRRDETTLKGSVTVRPRVLIPSGDPFPLSIGKKDSPWMTRGWTLQEWLLSPRVLHCGRERVWDCYETWHTESRLTWSGTFTSALNDTNNLRDSLASNIFARMGRLDPEIRQGGLDTHWARLVEDFTSRTLSCEMDKMPAIAGLARKFMEHSHAKAPGAKYLAGLWHYKGINPFSGRTYPTSQVPLGLLWRRSGADFMRSSATYRAPSWSWAALDGPVELFRDDWTLTEDMDREEGFKVKTMLKVEAANCFFDPPESLSLVQTAWIIASGLIKQAYTYTRTTRNNPTFHSGFANEYSQTFVDLCTDQSHDDTHWTGIFDQSLENTGIHYVDGSLYLLHVATFTRDRHLRPRYLATLTFEQDYEDLNHALVLERLDSFDHVHCFRRLGIAWAVPKDRGTTSDSMFGSATEYNDRAMLKDWETCRVRLI